MRRFLFLIACAVLLTAQTAAPARAQSPVVVELFTSQSCENCPPADAFLERLAARNDVIVLALHVDYWDDYGWKDSFAKPQFSNRQRHYTRNWGMRTYGTPQMVIQGTAYMAGGRSAEILRHISHYQAMPDTISLRVSRNGDVARIDLAPIAPGGVGMASVYMVSYIPRADVEIMAGQNAGQTLRYVNIVETWETLMEWNGQQPVAMEYHGLENRHWAVIVQADGFGPILAGRYVR